MNRSQYLYFNIEILGFLYWNFFNVVYPHFPNAIPIIKNIEQTKMNIYILDNKTLLIAQQGATQNKRLT